MSATTELRSDFFNWSWGQFSRTLGEGGMALISGQNSTPFFDATHPTFTQRLWKQERTESFLAMAKANKAGTYTLPYSFIIC